RTVRLLSSSAVVCISPTETYTLSLHDALPILLMLLLLTGCATTAMNDSPSSSSTESRFPDNPNEELAFDTENLEDIWFAGGCFRSEEHTSELQSRENLVCRLLLETKKSAQKRP